MMIRMATASDSNGICTVWNPLIESTATTFTTELKSAASIECAIAERQGAFFVAEDRGQIVGFASYFPFRGGPGYARTKEHSINLVPASRGKGAGRGLMNALEAHAVEQGIHSLWAGISAENPEGVSFHEHLGFSHIARLPEVGFKFGRWMDLVLMQKILE